MKRSGFLARRTPLQRHTRLKAKGSTSHARRERDTAYMAFVRTLPCLGRLLDTTGFHCEGEVQADHIGGRYVKPVDRNCIPLCREHHAQRTGKVGGRGVFAGWSLERKREWGREAVADTIRAWETQRTQGATDEDEREATR